MTGALLVLALGAALVALGAVLGGIVVFTALSTFAAVAGAVGAHKAAETGVPLEEVYSTREALAQGPEDTPYCPF